MAQDGTTLGDRAFTAGAGVGAGVADQVSDDKLVRLFAEGATMVLQGLHRLWPPLIGFSQELAADLGHPVQVNAYVTPPQSRGFSDHYDVHDVFVLQIEGEKRWRIHAPVSPGTAAHQPWTDRRADVEAAARTEPVLDAVLRPGDCLYLPRGYLHAATALGGVSTHVTIGVHAWNGHVLAEQLLAVALDRLAGDEDVRGSLPLGVDVGDPTGLTVDLELVRARLLRAVQEASVSEVARRMAARARSAQRAAPVGPLAQLRACATLDDAVLTVRPHLAPALEPQPDGSCLLRSRAGDLLLRDGDVDGVLRLLDGDTGHRRRARRGPRAPAAAVRRGRPGVSAAGPLCADGARARQDDLVGTAAPARRWLLLEHPAPGPSTPWAARGSRQTSRTGSARRPPGPAPASCWYADRGASPRARHAAGRSWTPMWTATPMRQRRRRRREDPGRSVGVLDLRYRPALQRRCPGGRPRGQGRRHATAEPLLLVCAHGRHDTCCAVRGRPVAARLAERWPVGTWECSHVGGDRFAANLLVLPGGACYGNLDPGNVVEVVQAHLEDRVSVEHLRGISTQPPVGQAAVAAVLRRFGPAGCRRWRCAASGSWAVSRGRWCSPAAGRCHAPSRRRSCAAARPRRG